jgi:hypothetical protein
MDLFSLQPSVPLQNLQPSHRRTWACGSRFLIAPSFPQEGRADHLVAAIGELAFRMSQIPRHLSVMDPPIADLIQLHRGSCYLQEGEAGGLPLAVA